MIQELDGTRGILPPRGGSRLADPRDPIPEEGAASVAESAELSSSASLAFLRELVHTTVQQGLTVKLIKTNPKTGAIFYYDPARAEDEQETPIPDGRAARALIDRHRKEAGNKTLFYKFERLPDPAIKQPAFPTGKQMEDYQQRWFRDVATESYVTSAGEGR